MQCDNEVIVLLFGILILLKFSLVSGSLWQIFNLKLGFGILFDIVILEFGIITQV